MNQELDQIEKNETRELVPRPEDKNIVGTKCILKKQVQLIWTSNKEQSKIGL